LKFLKKNFKNDQIKNAKMQPKKKTHLACWFLLVVYSSKDYLLKQIGGREHHLRKHKERVANKEE
jgi:hypothetical protein